MASDLDSPEATSSASYLRTIGFEEAVAAKSTVSTFFGAIHEPIVAPKIVQEVVRPKYAMRIVFAGLALFFAAVIAVIFRSQLPDSIPGFYLGVGGLLLIAGGAIYFYWASETIVPPPPAAIKAADQAQKIVDRQIQHFQSHTDQLFDADNRKLDMADSGFRAHLVGVGRKEWNDGHDISIREFEKSHILASVVHLVAIDLTYPFICIRQLGLDLATGTVSEEVATRHLLADVSAASHHSRKLFATNDWETAAEISADIRKIENKPMTEKSAQRIKELKEKISKLNFDDPCGDKFTLAFSNGETLTLVVSDSVHAKNPREIAYPIIGRKNLQKAIETWDEICVASARAKRERVNLRAELTSKTAGTHKFMEKVQTDNEGFRSALLDGLRGVQGNLSSLEVAMQSILAEIRSGKMGGGASAAAAVASPASTFEANAATPPHIAKTALLRNGHDPAPSPVAPPSAALPQTEPEPAKSGA